MKEAVDLNDITIRTELRPGDIGNVVWLHGHLYGTEYHYGVAFEAYVAMGMYEFYHQYDAARDRAWICEYQNKMVGFLLLMHRGDYAAQLRYFILDPAVRGLGLGNKLMDLYMAFLSACGYKSSYLWTTHELGTAAHLYKKHGFRLTEEKASTAFGKPLQEQRYDLPIVV